MRYGEYQFRAVLLDKAILPPYKGSTFRGVFGRALKAVTCALKREDCATCLINRQCVYIKVFDSPVGLPGNGRPSPPHPFVIEPPLSDQTAYEPGESFDFSLLLFGEANQYLPYFVYAFEQMGRIGIGRAINGRRAQFQLLQVSDATAEVIYRKDDRSLLPGEPVRLTLEGPQSIGSSEITVSLLTPLRLKYQEHLHDKLPFHVLIRAILRRMAALHGHFDNGEPPLDYKGKVARAQMVEVIKSTIRWVDWRRYSYRKQESMLMGGMVGEATYKGKLDEFLPLLRYGEIVHVGKATTFGLGKIQAILKNGI
jgi:CRISPR-associated endoribonuclease Cas6